MFNPSELVQFCGSQQWYRHPLRTLIMTEGTNHLYDNGAAWLMDVIASYQGVKLDRQTDGFQLWIIKVNADKSATVTCQADSNTPIIIKQRIPYTDFPMPELKLYVEGINQERVCLLPSEH